MDRFTAFVALLRRSTQGGLGRRIQPHRVTPTRPPTPVVAADGRRACAIRIEAVTCWRSGLPLMRAVPLRTIDSVPSSSYEDVKATNRPRSVGYSGNHQDSCSLTLMDTQLCAPFVCTCARYDVGAITRRETTTGSSQRRTDGRPRHGGETEGNSGSLRSTAAARFVERRQTASHHRLCVRLRALSQPTRARQREDGHQRPLSGMADASRVGRIIDWELAAERLSVAAVGPRKDLGGHRQRNSLGRTVAEVEADRPSHLRDERFA